MTKYNSYSAKGYRYTVKINLFSLLEKIEAATLTWYFQVCPT